MPLDQQQLGAALAHHREGRIEQAQAIYRQLLAVEPANADVLNLLGAACIQLRQWDEAAAQLSTALRVNPAHTAALDNLGVLLARQGRFAEAIAHFRQSIARDANNSQTQRNLGNALASNGEIVEAINVMARAVELAPGDVRVHSDLAKLLLAQGRLADAVPYMRRVAQLKPSDPQARFELAAALAESGQVRAAIVAYHETLTLKPDSAEAEVNLANLYVRERNYEEATARARRAVELRPDFAEAYVALAGALQPQKHLDEAIAALRTAVRLKPNLPEAHNNLGIALVEAGDPAGGIEQYRQALAIRPANPDGHYNLGIALYKDGRPAEAIEAYDAALALNSALGEAHHNRAAALLLLGRTREGLAEYEWRFRSRDFPALRTRWKIWDGGPLTGRSIVLCAEQGLGDSIQFIRLAQIVRQQAARVLFECPAVLHPLLARTPGIDEFLTPAGAADADVPTADCCVPLLSLPQRLGIELDTIPAQVPYIAIDDERRAAWRARLEGGFNIGIVWQGNPHCPGDAQRSIALAQFETLARIPGVRLISLQKGPGVEQLADARERFPVTDFGDELDRSAAFLDTAALMQSVDLVITSDTAAAHLAGALGVPVWVALSAAPDWRWLLARDDSPWYPSMRLFRQTSPGDWSGVFPRMTAEVARLAAPVKD